MRCILKKIIEMSSSESAADELRKPRKFSLNEATIYFLNFLMKKLNKNQKEQFVVIEMCIVEFYSFGLSETGGFSLSSLVDSDKENGFLQITCLNLSEPGSGACKVWPKLRIDTLNKLDQMNDYVAKNFGFKSSSSLVNHAIAFKFNQIDGAVENYLLDNDIGIPG